MIKFILPLIFVLVIYFQIEKENNDQVVITSIEFDEKLFEREILESINSFIEDIDIDSADIYIPFK